jgi:hypothetical protein
MADTDVVWPVGTTDQDPDLADRPLALDPEGFLVARPTWTSRGCRPGGRTVTAIVRDRYGAAPEDVLRVREVDRPVVGDDESTT